ncbi:MAG TPA: hypothetical protein VF532_01160 [Candidatus Angelobacter sp.]
MKPLVTGAMLAGIVLCLTLAASHQAAAQSGSTQPQTGQQASPQSPQPRTQSLSGSKTIEGCLERSGDGFAVKTDEGLYPLNTERDLTAYIGKKVRLHEQWEAKGTVTTGAISGGEKKEGGEPEAAAPPGRPSAFSGDFRLHVDGSVVGECTPK